MATPCKVATPRLSAIREVILSLQKEDSNIKTLKDVKDWFALNRPQITESEIVDSLITVSARNIRQAVDNLHAQERVVKERAKALNSLTKLADKIEVSGEAFLAPVKEMEAVNEAVRTLYSLSMQDNMLSEIEKIEVGDLAGKFQNAYSDIFDENKKMKDAALHVLRKSVKDLKTKFNEDKANKRVEKIKEKLDRLKNDQADVDDILDPEARVEPEEVSEELMRIENEISHLRSLFDKYKKERRIREKAKEGLLGFKSPTAVKLRGDLSTGISEAWEVMRSMKFMFDASVIGVQLAPIAIPDLVGLDVNALRKGDFANVFASQRRLKNLFRDQIFRVVKSDMEALSGRPGENWREKTKRAKGELALMHHYNILKDPLFAVARKSGLIISETRSSTKSEEYFHSTLLNKIPILGLIKDISEDAMVTPLNQIRFALFKEFYMANPGVSKEQLTKAAKFINELTGTANVSVGVFSWIFSAPRLAISRLSLAFLRPIQLAGRIDIPKSFKEGGLRMQGPADQFILKQMARMWGGYAKMFVLISALAALNPNDDLDWLESFKSRLKRSLGEEEGSDYMRVRLGSTSYDFTGGLAAMYRMFWKAALIANGPDDQTSYLGKKRYDMAKGALGQDPLDPIMETLIKNKLHPSISGAKAIYTGRDFFGNPFWMPGIGVGEVSSRLAGIVESFTPIYVGVAIDQFFNTPNSGFIEDNIIQAVQFFGVNTFEAQTKSQSVEATDYFNKVKFKPSTEYPKQLSTSDKDPSLQLEYLRIIYKKEYGDMVGELIEKNPNMSLSTFKSKVKAGSSKLQRDFLKEYRTEIKEIKK